MTGLCAHCGISRKTAIRDDGRAHGCKAELPPKAAGLRPVTIVQAVDATRCLDGFVAAAPTSPSP